MCISHYVFQCIFCKQQFSEYLDWMWFACNCSFTPSLPHVALLWNARVDWKGAIPDMIIKMIFNCGEAGSKPTPGSIKPEPRKPLLPLALDMFMFQLHYVKQPPTHNVSVWVPLCKYGCRSVSVRVCVCVWWIAVLPEWMVSRSHFSAGWFNRETA